MLMHEEMKVLRFLGERFVAQADELARACCPGAGEGWLVRVLANLDWLGYVTVFTGPDGEPDAVGLTDKGVALLREGAAVAG